MGLLYIGEAFIKTFIRIILSWNSNLCTCETDICFGILENVCVCVHSVVLDSCDSMDCNPPGSSVHGIFQARILEWVAISFPRDQTQVSCIGRFLTIVLPWKTLDSVYYQPKSPFDSQKSCFDYLVFENSVVHCSVVIVGQDL